MIEGCPYAMDYSQIEALVKVGSSGRPEQIFSCHVDSDNKKLRQMRRNGTVQFFVERPETFSSLKSFDVSYVIVINAIIFNNCC